MPVELKVPEVGESITEVEIGDWFKKQGDHVDKEESVVTLESEKATVELPAPEAGTLDRILKDKGQTAKVGEVIGYIDEGPSSFAKAAEDEKSKVQNPKSEARRPKPEVQTPESEVRNPKSEDKSPSSSAPLSGTREDKKSEVQSQKSATVPKPVPQEGGLEPQEEAPAEESQTPAPRPSPTTHHPQSTAQRPSSIIHHPPSTTAASRQEEVVPMSRLRRTVAERLVAAQRDSALLTTFNEIDMGAVMALRKQHGEAFRQKYKVKLGLMSFFVKAAIDALKQFAVVNAEVRGNDIVYHNYYDMGIAIGSGKGLVVPVLRNAERLSFAEIEEAIGDFAARAQENKLKVEELQGGTFTISNGGVYGSLLSTPIVNPPQSGVLGLHAIQERPVARGGSVVVRPMMYVALTYDHRIVDGREAVSFLKRVKESIEEPARMLIEV